MGVNDEISEAFNALNSSSTISLYLVIKRRPGSNTGAFWYLYCALGAVLFRILRITAERLRDDLAGVKCGRRHDGDLAPERAFFAVLVVDGQHLDGPIPDTAEQYRVPVRGARHLDYHLAHEA